MTARPPVAIVHDFLTQRGGAERVVLALAEAFPAAAIHTALYEPDATYPEFADLDVRPLGANRVRFLRRHHRVGLPAIVAAFERCRIDADVVVASTSGFSHAVGVTGAKVAYVHTPARWLHDPTRYLARFGAGARVAAALLRRPLRQRDLAAMGSADHVLVNSTTIRDEVRSIYGVDAEVVPPASTLSVAGPRRALPGFGSGFVLCPCRLLGYKRLDVLVAAASLLPDRRFVVVGDGPLLGRLRRTAPSNVTVVGAVTDAELRWAYDHSALVAVTAAEDFGLVPVEAAAFGRPVVAPAARGLLDHVRTGTSVLYELGSARALASAVERALATQWSSACFAEVAERFGVDRFRRCLTDVVAGAASPRVATDGAVAR